MKNFISDKISEASEKLSIPEGILNDDSVIEIINNKKVKIENHKGIFRYSSKEIVVKTNCSKVSVMGDELNIIAYITQEIVISGNISAITFS